jgi:hypothetical protein
MIMSSCQAEEKMGHATVREIQKVINRRRVSIQKQNLATAVSCFGTNYRT